MPANDDGSYPYVCPRCYAVGGEPCASDCEERARLEREEQEAELDDRDALEEDDDESFLLDAFFSTPASPSEDDPDDDDEDDDDERVPESQQVAPLQEAAAELALAERRLDEKVDRFLFTLRPTERALLRRRFKLDAVSRRERHRPSDIVATDQRTGQTTTRAELARDWQIAASGGAERTERAEAQLTAEDQRRQSNLVRIARRNLGIVDLIAPRRSLGTEPHAADDEEAETRRLHRVTCTACKKAHAITIAPFMGAPSDGTLHGSVRCACGVQITVTSDTGGTDVRFEPRAREPSP